MKLIACYVEGYGGIEKKEYTFEEGITSFCQENGKGKTTLASFLKAMLYGLKGYTDKSTEFCDREHFYPFKGGKFGGYITFSYNGKIYKVERYFGEKSTRGDTLKVYCNGEITEELGEDIGRTVFGVDENSFLRTLFIGSDEIEIKSTSSINAKLGSFLQGMEEETGFDEALKKLDDARKSYQADRRSKNPTEFIPCQERELEEIRNDIDNAKTIQIALDGKKNRVEGLKTEISLLNKQIVAVQEENERRKAFEHYESLAEGIADKRKKAEEISVRYPMGLPTEEETEIVNVCLGREKELLASAEAVEFSVKDSEKLARLEDRFVRGVPTEEEVLQTEKQIDSLKVLETEISIASSKQATERERALSQKFVYACPTEGQIAEIAVKVDGYKQAKKEYEETPDFLTKAVESKQSTKVYTALAVLAGLLCVGGVLLLALLSDLFGGIALAVGGILLLGDAFLFLNKKSTEAQTATMSALNPEKQRRERALNDFEYSIKASLMQFGYHSDNGVAFDFAELQKDAYDYAQYLSAENERKKTLTEKQTKKSEMEECLLAFFRGYDLSGDTYIKLLSDLRNMVSEYFSLKERSQAQCARKKELQQELEEIRVRILAYKRKYGLTEIRVNDILTDIRAYARLCAEIERETVQALAYKQREGLTEKPMGERVDLASLQSAHTEKVNELSRLEREIQADETEAEKIDDLLASLSEGEEKLKEYKQKHKLLKAAKELLESADGKLKDAYVKPIKDEFLYYAEALEKTLGEKVVMTKNFEIRFEREGEERIEKHLSAGQRSICALCFRLALIKNMYKENPPFLILDDPFVALDDGHMEKVKDLLSKLSKEMQMVYFTCHESRMV